MAKSKSRLKKSSPKKGWVPNYVVKRGDLSELAQVRDAYYQAVDYEYEPKSRVQMNVILRVAFADAMQPFFTVVSIAKCLEKDHSSVCYYLRNADLYSQHFSFYKMLRETASCIYHMEVGNTSMGMRLKDNIKQYVEALESS